MSGIYNGKKGRLILVIFAVVLLVFGASAVSGAMLVVNQTDPACIAGDSYHLTITDAVGNASAVNNDTIKVCAGTYNEDVVIDKPLSMTGVNGSSMTNITPPIGVGFTITASWTNLSGFNVTGATTVGIYLNT